MAQDQVIGLMSLPIELRQQIFDNVVEEPIPREQFCRYNYSVKKRNEIRYQGRYLGALLGINRQIREELLHVINKRHAVVKAKSDRHKLLTYWELFPVGKDTRDQVMHELLSTSVELKALDNVLLELKGQRVKEVKPEWEILVEKTCDFSLALF
ncbi:hypothetical protein NA57DRAFT_73738 [Rhizodiscina lignyota]|uniref:Uncharacterized protein n=1 Tax=Rhizodiscina lignyota TaxID=1504668 RepID=A0A9P4IN59_9PEZI|nr:hypothetical protein NA57DRAFT_73738 [Rhizodiscina lignyota]